MYFINVQIVILIYVLYAKQSTIKIIIFLIMIKLTIYVQSIMNLLQIIAKHVIKTYALCVMDIMEIKLYH